MFASEPVELIRNDVFLLKLALVGLALANALLFRRYARNRLQSWDVKMPGWAKVSAAMSLLLWGAAIIAGRMIAYQ